MSDPETIRVYDDQAAEYAQIIQKPATSDPMLGHFINACPSGGRVLDLGCGPGLSAGQMAAQGLIVDATDASISMVDLAKAQAGVTAWQASFDDLDEANLYEGIWASFSLLHAPRAMFPTYLAAIHRALKPGGIFHIGMKLGEDSARDGIGRQYTYYSEEDLTAHLQTCGFTPVRAAHGSDRGLDGVMADWIIIQAHA